MQNKEGIVGQQALTQLASLSSYCVQARIKLRLIEVRFLVRNFYAENSARYWSDISGLRNYQPNFSNFPLRRSLGEARFLENPLCFYNLFKLVTDNFNQIQIHSSSWRSHEIRISCGRAQSCLRIKFSGIKGHMGLHTSLDTNRMNHDFRDQEYHTPDYCRTTAELDIGDGFDNYRAKQGLYLCTTCTACIPAGILRIKFCIMFQFIFFQLSTNMFSRARRAPGRSALFVQYFLARHRHLQ